MPQDLFDSPAYVRLAEAIFPAYLIEYALVNGDHRYGWREATHDPAFWYNPSQASPGRCGTPYVNHAMHLRNLQVPLPDEGLLVWMRLKGSVGQQQTYEFVESLGSGPTYLNSTSITLTTDQNNYQIPTGARIVQVTLSSNNVSITGLVLNDNQTVTFVVTQASTYSLLIPHQSTSSLTTNRFTTVTQQTIVVPPGGSITVWKDVVTDRVVTTDLSTVPGLKKAPQTATITTTPQNNYPTTAGSDTLVITATTVDVDLTGLVPASPSQTTTFTIVNDTTSTKLVTLKNLSGSSTTGNQFDFPDGADLVLRPGTSVTITRLAGASTKWKTTGFPDRLPWVPTITGTINNPAFPAGGFPDVLKPILSGAATLKGFPANMPVGVPLTILNPSSNSDNLTIANAAGTSDLDFTTSTGADVVLTPGESLTVVYDGTSVVETAASIAASAPGLVSTSADGLAPQITGSDGYVLTKSGTAAVWAAASGGSSTTGTNGEDSTAGTPYTVTNSFADTGVSASLPGAGTYLLTVSGSARASASSGTSNVVSVRLYNVTGSAAVGSTTFEVLAVNAAMVAHVGGVAITKVLTVAGATTVRLEAAGTSTDGNPTVEATLDYVQLS